MVAEMDHETLHFQLIPQEEVEAGVTSERQSVRAARYQERRAFAQSIMKNRPEGATIAEIAAAMGIGYSVAWPLVREMTASGRLEEIGAQESAGGRPSPIFRLIRTSEFE